MKEGSRRSRGSSESWPEDVGFKAFLLLLLLLLFVVAIRPELLPIFQLRLVLLTLSMASETSLTALCSRAYGSPTSEQLSI